MYKHACVILTEGCNFKCPFCFEGETHYDRKMSDETFEKIINKLKKENIRAIALFGGEPLLNFTARMQELLFENKDFFELSIYTNGSLLTPAYVDWFLQFKKIKINVSCHNERSIRGAKYVAQKAEKHQYSLMLVCDHLTFESKFKVVKPLVDEYDSMLGLQLLIPDFDYKYNNTLPIYEALILYRKNLQEYELFNGPDTPTIQDGSNHASEIIFTYDGHISLTTAVGLSEDTVTYPLETKISDIAVSDTNPNNSPIQHFPWQCSTCPIKNYKKANCPCAWGQGHDFTLCRRQMLLYAIIKEEKELLCDEIMAEQPMPESYTEYNNKIQNIMLNVTDDCNFRCRMCFCHWNPTYMTEEVADKAIELALSRKNPLAEKVTINFFGGEPMMNFPLIQYVIEKYKDRCEFSMTTNGSLLTDENLQYLSDNKVGLLFSIDGDKETQDYNRPCADGTSSFDILAPKIPKILSLYPQVTFRSTIIPETVHLLHHNYQFAKESGFRNYFCTPDAYSDWAPDKAAELEKQCYLIAVDIIRDIYEGKPPLMPKFFIDGLIDYLRIKDNLTVPSCSPFRCGMGIYGFGVGATGIIAACQEHSTITDDDDIFAIGDVWSGISEEKHWKLIDKFHKEKASWIAKECEGCKLKNICINHVCPSRQDFMFKRFDKHAVADCIWTRIGYHCGKLTFEFFENNFSPNFEDLLKLLLEKNNLGLNKEVSYEI